MAEEFEDRTKKPESDNKNKNQENNQPIKIRAKLPRKGQIIGIIEQRLGGNKMHVSCTDGKTRNSRVPGRLKRRLWLRPNDVVIVEPWELDDTKADILFKYPLNQIHWLRNNGYLETEKNEF